MSHSKAVLIADHIFYTSLFTGLHFHGEMYLIVVFDEWCAVRGVAEQDLPFTPAVHRLFNHQRMGRVCVGVLHSNLNGLIDHVAVNHFESLLQPFRLQERHWSQRQFSARCFVEFGQRRHNVFFAIGALKLFHQCGKSRPRWLGTDATRRSRAGLGHWCRCLKVRVLLMPLSDVQRADVGVDDVAVCLGELLEHLHCALGQTLQNLKVDRLGLVIEEHDDAVHSRGLFDRFVVRELLEHETLFIVMEWTAFVLAQDQHFSMESSF
jgi:hypothetical protein